MNLSVAELSLWRAARAAGNSLLRRAGAADTIWFDRAPLTLRAAGRLGVTPETVLGLLSRVSGARFRRLAHDTALADYPAIQARALEDATRVVEAFMRALEADPVVRAGIALSGRDGALSFAMKLIAQALVYREVLTALVARANVETGGELVHEVSPSLGRSLAPVLSETTGVRTRAPEGVGPWLARRLSSFAGTVGLLGVLLGAVLRRGLRLRSRPVVLVELALEYIDADHLGGRAHDADVYVDGERFTTDNVGFFLTGAQARYHAAALRVPVGEIARRAREAAAHRGYRLVVLDDEPYPLGAAARALGWVVAHGWPGTLRSVLGARVLPALLSAHLDLLGVFLALRPRAVILASFPNGKCTFRITSGVLTGLCRERGALSVGLQTRSTYLRKFEDLWEAYDLYLLWGPRYRAALGDEGMAFVGREGFVGSTNLDPGLLTAAGRMPSGGSRKRLLAFSGDVVPRGRDFRHHHTYGFNRAFLEVLGTLARDHPEVDVVVKLKDPEGVDYFLGDPGVAWMLGEAAPRNLVLVRRARDSYRDELAKADVVCAMGFTSPGVDALLLGKPVIYFSLLGDGRSHFSRIPELTAHDPVSFATKLSRALSDPAGVAEGQAWLRAELDPFGDGRAHERVGSAILKALEGASDEVARERPGR